MFVGPRSKAVDENTALTTLVAAYSARTELTDFGTVAWSKEGADAGSFVFSDLEELRFTGSSPDFERKTAYSVTIKAVVTNSGGQVVATAEQDVSISINDLPEAGAPGPPNLSIASSSDTRVTANVKLTTDGSSRTRVALMRASYVGSDGSTGWVDLFDGAVGAGNWGKLTVPQTNPEYELSRSRGIDVAWDWQPNRKYTVQVKLGKCATGRSSQCNTESGTDVRKHR